MKYSKKYIIAFIIVLVMITGCAKRTTFNESAVLPAARGSVKVKEDRNNNYQITVSVKHLAEPERITPPKRFYVEWIETGRSNFENIGQLVSRNSLTASLEAVSPYNPRRVFITAEDQGNVQYPGPVVVLDSYMEK